MSELEYDEAKHPEEETKDETKDEVAISKIKKPRSEKQIANTLKMRDKMLFNREQRKIVRDNQAEDLSNLKSKLKQKITRFKIKDEVAKRLQEIADEPDGNEINNDTSEEEDEPIKEIKQKRKYTKNLMAEVKKTINFH